MTSEETRDLSLSGKSDRSTVKSNTIRVEKSRHVNRCEFTAVAILNDKNYMTRCYVIFCKSDLYLVALL